jgi:signal transduction histidine kinase
MAPRSGDLLIGLGAAAFGVAGAAAEGSGAEVCAAAAIIGAALGAARRHPRAAWIGTVAVLLVIAPADVAFFVAVLVAAHAFCAGRREDRWAGVAAGLALIGALELGVLLNHEAGVPALLIPGAGWAAGRALRERELVAAQLAERARELEEEREAHAELSVRYERARIASELHDIVAHAISVMVVQASAGQRVAHDPRLTAETFEAIAGAAREAEQDMGRLVALLSDEGAIGPAPDLALVEELVARASGSGLDVVLRLDGEREGLPAPVVQAAYRVVQEGLTNALRYAAGATVSVLVRGDAEALVIAVENGPAGGQTALAGIGTGHGLRGLRERVGACGGTLEAGPTADGGWRLSARLLTRAGERERRGSPAGMTTGGTDRWSLRRTSTEEAPKP